MNKYIFTLFVRFFIPFSGFIVFLVSSKLFGAEGRGIIGYGTSLISIFGLLFSMNLGRMFLSKTKGNVSQQQEILSNILVLNYLLVIAGIFISFLFWYFNSYARTIIDSQILLAFLILTPYYVWSINANGIYATLNKTINQDILIFLQRVSLVCVCLWIYFCNIQDIKKFIYLYSVTLGIGTLIEMSLLVNLRRVFFKMSNIKQYISDSMYGHIDYLAFNIYPLILILVAGVFLKLSDLGRLNFLIQTVNFIFILSIVASIRMKTYVSDRGMIYHLRSIKKLFVYTSIISLFLIICISFVLNTSFFNQNFSTFGDLLILFCIISFAVPGYIAYQFFYPVLIEYEQIHFSMKINLFILLILTAFTYPVLKLHNLIGAVLLFTAFYLLIFLAQFYMYKRIRRIALI